MERLRRPGRIAGESAMEKQRVREAVWRLLQEKKVSRFPGAYGRIPNFAGAEAAAARLRELDVWQRAQVIKANPDLPQRRSSPRSRSLGH